MPQHFNELTPAEHERLSLLFEEASEVIQIVGKIMRHGYESTHPDGGPTNRKLLEKEIGDFLFAKNFLLEVGDINEDRVSQAETEKMSSVDGFLHHNKWYLD